MKFDLTAHFYGFAFSFMFKSYCKQHPLTENVRSLLKDVNTEYRAMVERTPGIGGKENSLEAMLVGACYFFAMAKKVPNMTPELLDKIIDSGLHSSLMVNAHARVKKKGTLFSQKTLETRMREAERSQTSTYEMDWKYTYQGNAHEFYCTYTQCGLCRLAKKEQMEEYLPCLCKMDFGNYELQGGRLIRTKTLANGDDCCNFHVVKIE